MNNLFKAISVSVITSCAAIIAFFFIRADYIHESYMTHLLSLNQSLVLELKPFLEGKTKDEAESALKTAASSKKEVAFIALTDMQNNYLGGFSGLTQKEIKNGFSDLIISDIKNGKLSASKVESKYYGSEKFYYIKLKGVKFAFFVVYRYKLQTKLITEIIIETSIILLIIFISSFSFFYFFRKANQLETNPESAVLRENPKETQRRTNNFEKLLAKKFSEAVQIHSYESFAYYHYDKENLILVKKYYYTAGILSKLDQDPPEAEKRKEIISELKKGSPIIKARSKNAYIAVIENKNLLGAVLVTKNKTITGTEISFMKNICRDIAYNIIK
ncbi:MAG: hypothetical protein KAZ87_03180 [Spirochaetes bacterium]|nr:hypothetical protein [Spirochaetota bacterium]